MAASVLWHRVDFRFRPYRLVVSSLGGHGFPPSRCRCLAGWPFREPRRLAISATAPRVKSSRLLRMFGLALVRPRRMDRVAHVHRDVLPSELLAASAAAGRIRAA